MTACVGGNGVVSTACVCALVAFGDDAVVAAFVCGIGGVVVTACVYPLVLTDDDVVDVCVDALVDGTVTTVWDADAVDTDVDTVCVVDASDDVCIDVGTVCVVDAFDDVCMAELDSTGELVMVSAIDVVNVSLVTTGCVVGNESDVKAVTSVVVGVSVVLAANAWMTTSRMLFTCVARSSVKPNCRRRAWARLWIALIANPCRLASSCRRRKAKIEEKHETIQTWNGTTCYIPVQGNTDAVPRQFFTFFTYK